MCWATRLKRVFTRSGRFLGTLGMSDNPDHPEVSATGRAGAEGRGSGLGAHASRDSDPPTAPAPLASVTIPKGGGAIRGIGEKFGTNPATGSGTMTVPIATSPGRSDFGPQLSLSYGSTAGNGPFGFGWHLPLPLVTRKTDKGRPQYLNAEESDVFILSGAEDLVPVLVPDAQGELVIHEVEREGHTVRRYRPRTDHLFARIERWTDPQTKEIHWRSISRDNVTTVYGRDNNSRIFDPDELDPDHPRLIFSWLISESYDSKGNAIVYEYVGENDANINRMQANERNRVRNANRYIKRIKYGNRVSRLIEPNLGQARWLFEVVFDYGEGHYEALPSDEDGPLEHLQPEPAEVQLRHCLASEYVDGQWSMRPDPFSSYQAGFEVRTYRRCHRILTFHLFDDLGPGYEEAELGPEPYLVHSTNFNYADLSYDQPPSIDDELAHQGSTRFASFIRSITQSGYVRDGPTVDRNGVQYLRYLQKSLPPLEFEYSKAKIHDEVKELDESSRENLPIGVEGVTYQWVDLDGEGVPGILTRQAGAWLYKPNLGDAKFGKTQTLPTQPSLFAMAAGGEQLLDLSGDGQLDVVAFSGPTPGFYERTKDHRWEPFRAFRKLPNIAWNEPNLRFVDLNGDGHADVLITEHEVFDCYPSLEEDGFGEARHVRKRSDEEAGARLIFADGTQSIYLAEMSGGGLTDLVRIRNGETCYWPALGYGRFGAKVTMDNAPWFDNPDQFDHGRIRLADIDGSGATDIIYLGRDCARVYFNQSGNRWSEARSLTQFPKIDNLSSVTTVDLLGNGTACLAWSSPLIGDSQRPLRYIELMGAQKPHLLIRSANNLGAETHVDYASSTKFYLADKRADKPWITRLPFPIQVVERVETYDQISRNRFVNTYAYHHGYFDGEEREFRGFGMVEQWDTEKLGVFTKQGDLPTGNNFDKASHVPPAHTKTWFHTGAHQEAGRISRLFEAEYYREGDESRGERRLSDDQLKALVLPDTLLPPGLTAEEQPEAYRALRGSILRQEIYADDASDSADRPYSVSERNYTVKMLQGRGGNKRAVFFTHSRETVDLHYERKLVDDGDQMLADPRVSHQLTLVVDDFGNVERSVGIGYRRRDLPGIEEPEQLDTHLTLTCSSFANAADQDDWYRAGLPAETRAFEIVNPPDPKMIGGIVVPFTFDEIDALSEALFPTVGVDHPEEAKLWPYWKWDWRTNPMNAPPLPIDTRLRLIEHVRTYYRTDNLNGQLALREVQSRALPHESYKLAFTSGLLDVVYGDRIDLDMLQSGGYVHTEWDDGSWWIPSGRVYYSADQGHTPQEEEDYAREHFFLPHRFEDPFGNPMTVTYDEPRLLVRKTQDALENTVRTETEDEHGDTKVTLDYRVLQPWFVTDPNGNRSQVAFDALGMVTATAVMGKREETKGDILSNNAVQDLTKKALNLFFKRPKIEAPKFLDTATSRVIYDLWRYYHTRDSEDPEPAYAATIVRETHVADLPQGEHGPLQVSFSYSDGFGREIQKKAQAEDGPVTLREDTGAIEIDGDGQLRLTADDVSPRWVGNGWTVFNNKGKPVRQYEPYFSPTHRFEYNVHVGASVVMFYDPLERVIATLHPNHTYDKIVFGPWWQSTYDVSDTVSARNTETGDPRTDPDVKGYVEEHFKTQPDWETWFQKRQGGALGAEEQASASKATIHAATPTVAHADSLGRTILTVAHNRFQRSNTPAGDPPIEAFYKTCVVLDIEGNQREVVDALDRIVVHYGYDLLGNRVHQASMEAGKQWMLNDVTGNPIYAWNSRGYRFHTAYDELRRPKEYFMQEGAGDQLLIGRSVYGESRLDAEANNLRGKLVQLFDQAGVITREEYDFKGNILSSSRQLTKEYKETIIWSDVVPRGETYTSSTRFDALNRPTQLVAPHNDQLDSKINVIQPSYNEANLLERIDVWLDHGALPNAPLDPAATPPSHVGVEDIEYDAKGQRLAIAYKNGVITRYRYDPETFRLIHLYTRRGAAYTDDCENPEPPPPETIAAPDDPPAGVPCGVQSLRYTYDPAGNITHVRDHAQQTIFFRNTQVDPTTEYTYDAIFRLIEATGREHLGQAGGPTIAHSYNDAPRAGFLQPNNVDQMGRYREHYFYDAVGNIESMEHKGTAPPNPTWIRTYAYNEASPLQPGKHSNRLSSTTIGTTTATYSLGGNGYDSHGNMLRMPQIQILQWDFNDQLRMTQRQAVDNADGDGVAHQGERTWYVYDSDGHRVRKVTEYAAGHIKDERTYLEGAEIYRRSGGNPLMRETLHIMDDKQQIALVETRTQPKEPEKTARFVRYQFGNHLGSAVLELDDKARIISYEEYTPYGSTSYQAVDSQIEAPKRYRYTSKERDKESGLYYYGARYYAPWLGRWTACDPSGLIDGPNVYSYARANPSNMTDPSGHQAAPDSERMRFNPQITFDAGGVTFGSPVPSMPDRAPQQIRIPREALSPADAEGSSDHPGFWPFAGELVRSLTIESAQTKAAGLRTKFEYVLSPEARRYFATKAASMMERASQGVARIWRSAGYPAISEAVHETVMAGVRQLTATYETFEKGLSSIAMQGKAAWEATAASGKAAWEATATRGKAAWEATKAGAREAALQGRLTRAFIQHSVQEQGAKVLRAVTATASVIAGTARLVGTWIAGVSASAAALAGFMVIGFTVWWYGTQARMKLSEERRRAGINEPFEKVMP